jgi:hypothetical protein
VAQPPALDHDLRKLPEEVGVVDVVAKDVRVAVAAVRDVESPAGDLDPMLGTHTEERT